MNNLYRQLDAARLEYQLFQDALYVAHPSLKLRSGQTAPLTQADVNQLTLRMIPHILDRLWEPGHRQR